MYKTYRTLIILSLLFIISCSSKYDSIDNGFDKICLIYTDVFSDPALKDRSIIEKHELVYDLVKGNVTDVDAITTFVAVAKANPDEKYTLFKQSAEYSLKRAWDCELIRNYNYNG